MNLWQLHDPRFFIRRWRGYRNKRTGPQQKRIPAKITRRKGEMILSFVYVICILVIIIHIHPYIYIYIIK